MLENIKFNYKTASNLNVRSTKNWNNKRKLSMEATRILAFLDSEVVGQIVVCKNWIYYLTVNPKYRGVGIGSKLLKKAEKLIAKDFMFATLHPQDDNEDLIEFYLAKGYEITNSDNIMQKQLFRI